MYYVVFDVGGSAIKHALMNEEGNFLHSGSIPTPKDSIETFIDEIGKLCETYQMENEIAGLAMSMPCPVDPKTGRISGGSAIRYIHGPDVLKMLRERTGLPVRMENDGNCAGLAEGFKGNASQCDNYVVMVIGSGIGGTVVINKKVVHGKNLHTGEFGCMIIDDVLKEPIGDIYSKRAATAGLINSVADALGVDPSILTGERIFEMAEEGNKIVKKELEKFYKYLAVGIFNIQYAIDPEKILIGGAISKNKTLFTEVNKILKDMKSRNHVIDITVEPCRFYGEANLIGALYNFMDREGHSFA